VVGVNGFVGHGGVNGETFFVFFDIAVKIAPSPLMLRDRLCKNKKLRMELFIVFFNMHVQGERIVFG